MKTAYEHNKDIIRHTKPCMSYKPSEDFYKWQKKAREKFNPTLYSVSS